MSEEQQQLFGIEKLNIPRSQIPAVTHVDYSARIQTVHKETNPKLWELFVAFEGLTGCPVLINTSFNVRGEPIVCTPEDAYRCFMRTVLNGAILLGIVLFLNFFLLLLNALDNSVFIPLKSDPRAEVANYKDKEFGRELFKDLAGLGVEYRPFVGWRRLEYHGKTTNIDADGIRMHPGYKDVSGLKRAAFFGGSTMWGTGADDNGTIPALVHALNPDISTINYGDTGYNSRQNLEMLINEFNEGKRFDYVIFYDGVNEIGGCRPGAKAYHHGQESVYRQKLDPSVSGLLINYFSPTLQLSKKIGKKFFNQQFYDNYVCDENPDRARQVAKTMFFNWDLARIVSEKYGARFIGLLQPVA